MKKVLFIILVIIFSVIGIKAGSRISNSVESKNTAAAPSVDNTDKIPTAPKKVSAGIPQGLVIPKIKIDTKVESAGLDEQKKPILPEDPDNVVWYNLGSRPGDAGSSVISGHFDKVTGSPAVFWDLKKLEPGDEIYITDSNGNRHPFSVTKKVDYPFDEVPLQEIYAAKTDKPLLNLITCSGEWNAATKLYSTRTVIYAEAVDK